LRGVQCWLASWLRVMAWRSVSKKGAKASKLGGEKSKQGRPSKIGLKWCCIAGAAGSFSWS